MFSACSNAAERRGILLRCRELVCPCSGSSPASFLRMRARHCASDARSPAQALRSKVDTIVVIYAENRAFDNLYGNFPGRAGLERSRGPRRPAAARVCAADRSRRVGAGDAAADLGRRHRPGRTAGGDGGRKCGLAQCAVLDRACLHPAIQCHSVDVDGHARPGAPLLRAPDADRRRQERRLRRMVRRGRPRHGALRLQRFGAVRAGARNSCSPTTSFKARSAARS